MPPPTVLPLRLSEARSADNFNSLPSRPRSSQESKSRKLEDKDDFAKQNLHLDHMETSPVESNDVKQQRLSIPDIQALFTGAPHFTLEESENGKFHPQTFFPWSKGLETADLLDRKLIGHKSFASATLHPHVPVPTRVNGRVVPVDPQHKFYVGKRPVFDVGIFEVPNMIDYDGKEPGTIGMRHFLEIPIRDSKRNEKEVKESVDAARASCMTKMMQMDAKKAMQYQETLRIGKYAAWRDRESLIRKERGSWKDLGIQEISLHTIKARIAVLGKWYDQMVKEGWKGTILDYQEPETLYEELFSLMLTTPTKMKESSDHSIAVQIEALVNVLATPGAWFDFSLVQWRFRLGELLWEVPALDRAHPDLDPGARRHWLLVQTLLSIELGIRLDAALRCGKVHLSEGRLIPEVKVYHSNRTEKVDWDLVLARSFLDEVYIEDHPGVLPQHRPPMPERKTTGIFSKWKRRKEQDEPQENSSAWDCVVLPRHLELQLEGLLHFAEAIQWPHYKEFEAAIIAKVDRYKAAKTHSERQAFLHPLECRTAQTISAVENARLSVLAKERKEDKKKNLLAILQPANQFESGGWLSRSWFAGLILPGASISHFLISSVLEHCSESLRRIGSQANLCGGFLLHDQCWWSKASIVGKVMAPCDGASESMGWITTPNIHPIDQSGKPLPESWMTIKVRSDLDTEKNPRIQAGRKVAQESSPVGVAPGRIIAEDFISITDDSFSGLSENVKVENLILRRQRPEEDLSASIDFTVSGLGSKTPVKISWELSFDVHFVAAHACRVVNGVTILQDEQNEIRTPTHIHGTLPGHPLHKSFHHSLKPISYLLEPDSINVGQKQTECVIIDARGENSRQVLARAWCAKVGKNAIISRGGRTCLSCSIREAKALNIGIIIRIGIVS